MSARLFYDQLAPDYHLIFKDWGESVRRQGGILHQIIQKRLPHAPELTLYDCSCGIGTQAIGLALQGYTIHATDLSPASIERARIEATNFSVNITFGVADFRTLAEQVNGDFDVVISCDNSLPHLLTDDDLLLAAHNLYSKVKPSGVLLITIRNYDDLLQIRPQTTPVSVYDSDDGTRRISFQVWDWHTDAPRYTVHHYILTGDPASPETRHRQTTYRALKRDELNRFLNKAGFDNIQWQMPAESGYYQPIVTAHKA